MKNWSKIILTTCTLALIGVLVQYAFKINHTTNHYTIEYTITTDSLGHVSTESRALADSIIHEIQKQEHLLEDKYEHVIDQQSNTQDLLAIGGVLLGIIVSIVGFFGYSTMQSIEEKAEAKANDAATDAYNKTIKSLQDKGFKEYLEDKAKPEVDKKIQEALNKFEGDKTASIDDLQARMGYAETALKGLCKKAPKTEQKEEHEVQPEPNAF